MARTFVHRREAGLEHFELKENHYDAPDLSTVTSVTVDVGGVTVYSTGPSDGPVRWNTSELKRGEIIALVPTASFEGSTETAQVTIVSPDYPTGLVWASQTISVLESSYFGQGGVNREQCDVCGGWFKVTDLVRQLQILKRNERANYLYSSRYDSTYWEIVGADYLGEGSMGYSKFYWKVHPHKNANMAGGAHCFWGDGELVAKDALDLSGYCTALLRGRFGTHQTTKQPGLTVEFGFYYDYGGAGQTRYSIGTATEVETRTAFKTTDLSAIAEAHRTALQPFYKITTYDDQQIWWAEGFRLQKDESTLGLTTATSKGAPVDEAQLEKNFVTAVVCPKHRMELEKQVDEYQPTFDDVQIVETEDQEF